MSKTTGLSLLKLRRSTVPIAGHDRPSPAGTVLPSRIVQDADSDVASLEG